VDLGNFIAWLHWFATVGRISVDRIDVLAAAFLDGYRSAGGIADSSTIKTHLAAGLLSLAPKPFRTRIEDWPLATETLVSTAHDVLAEATQRTRRASGRSGTASGESRRRQTSPVHDPTGGINDMSMPYLADALNPAEAEKQLRRNLVDFAEARGRFNLVGIRVVRHKPERRCLVEYTLRMRDAPAGEEHVVLLGKIKARRFDRRTYHLQQFLGENGFDTQSRDGVSVPEPVGSISDYQMWLQRHVAGQTAGELLTQPEAPDVAEMVARAIAKLHASAIPCDRSHAISDELDILDRRLAMVAESYPRWRRRVGEIAKACRQLGQKLDPWPLAGIHRDFYPDQIIVAGERAHLLDLDLFSRGNPALDVGNFQAHIVEHSLRQHMKPELHANVEKAFRDEYLRQTDPTIADNIERCVTLTLARHLFISTKTAEREHITGLLLNFCEARLEIDIYRQAV